MPAPAAVHSTLAAARHDGRAAWSVRAGTRVCGARIAMLSLAAMAIACAIAMALAGGRARQSPDSARAPLANIEAKASGLAAVLAADCPIAARNAAAADESCRRRIYGSPVLRLSLGAAIAWGRAHKDQAGPPDIPRHSAIASSVLTEVYLPLLAFDGRFKVDWSARHGLWLVELGARGRAQQDGREHTGFLRGEDDPGAGYEHAEAVMLWLDPAARQIVAGQVLIAPGARQPPLPAVTPIAIR